MNLIKKVVTPCQRLIYLKEDGGSRSLSRHPHTKVKVQVLDEEVYNEFKYKYFMRDRAGSLVYSYKPSYGVYIIVFLLLYIATCPWVSQCVGPRLTSRCLYA